MIRATFLVGVLVVALSGGCTYLSHMAPDGGPGPDSSVAPEPDAAPTCPLPERARPVYDECLEDDSPEACCERVLSYVSHT